MKCNLLIFASVLSLCQADSIFDNKLYHDVLDPDLCDQQLKHMQKSEFYDSSFRVPQGLLGGNFENFGDYYQCLAINQNFPGRNIEGKYCMVDAQLTPPILKIPTLGGVSQSDNLTWTERELNWSKNDILYYLSKYDGQQKINVSNAAISNKHVEPVIHSVKLSLGVCVPKPCTAHALLRPYAEHPRINFTYEEQFCRLPGDKPFAKVDYVVFCILSLLGILTVLSTMYELSYIFILKRNPAEASELLCACSLYRNSSRLLTFADNPRALDCLDGIRSLSILWVIVIHSYLTLDKYGTNKLEMQKRFYELDHLWIINAVLAVDTFIVLSGMLLVYTATYKMKPKTLLRNLHYFYLNRYMRLFPLLAGVVLLHMSVMHRMADGPRWNHVVFEFQNCRDYWWTTLLHVQNIVNPTDMCVGPTWYLSVDMQLYVVSPLVLYWVLGSARAAWTALTAAVLASLAATLAICFYFNFPIHTFQEMYFTWYYQNTITRSPPFFIGMLLGYILHVFRDKKVKLSKWGVFLGNSLAVVLFSYAFYIVYPTKQLDWDNQASLNVHNALFRSCWAFALCWLIFSCVHGYGGPVNWFLSLKLWRFPARISYAMYLYHIPMQTLLFGAALTSSYYSNMTLVLVNLHNNMAQNRILSRRKIFAGLRQGLSDSDL